MSQEVSQDEKRFEELKRLWRNTFNSLCERQGTAAAVEAANLAVDAYKTKFYEKATK